MNHIKLNASKGRDIANLVYGRMRITQIVFNSRPNRLPEVIGFFVRQGLESWPSVVQNPNCTLLFFILNFCAESNCLPSDLQLILYNSGRFFAPIIIKRELFDDNLSRPWHPVWASEGIGTRLYFIGSRFPFSRFSSSRGWNQSWNLSHMYSVSKSFRLVYLWSTVANNTRRILFAYRCLSARLL